MNVRQSLLAATAIVLLALVVVDLVEVDLGKDDLIKIGTFILAVAGYLKEGKSGDKTGVAKSVEAQATPTVPQSFRVRLDGGLFGGLAGGCLAGVIIGLVYTPGSAGTLFPGPIPDIIVASAVTGTALGVLTELFSTWFVHLSKRDGQSALLFNEFTGGLLGGLLTGGLIGCLLGWYFGPRDDPLIQAGTLLVGAVPGTIVIVLIMIVYEAGGLSRALVRNVLVAMVTGAIVAVTGLAAAEISGLTNRIEDYFLHGEGSDYILGGALLGLLAGVVLGTVLGMNLILRRIWIAR